MRIPDGYREPPHQAGQRALFGTHMPPGPPPPYGHRFERRNERLSSCKDLICIGLNQIIDKALGAVHAESIGCLPYSASCQSKEQRNSSLLSFAVKKQPDAADKL
jgi:hypothetical protein